MSKYSSQELDAIYHALANSSRRLMLTRLCKEQSLTVTQLAEPFDMSLAGVSKHIKVLEKAGLISKRREGTTYHCTPKLDGIQPAMALINYLDKFSQGTAGAQPQEDAVTAQELETA